MLKDRTPKRKSGTSVKRRGTTWSRTRLARHRHQPPLSPQEAIMSTPAQPGVGQTMGTATAQPIAGTRQPTTTLLEAARLHLADRQMEGVMEGVTEAVRIRRRRHRRRHRRRRHSRSATKARTTFRISPAAHGTC